ncbi:MAG: hypothetical protein GY717_10640 [Rhodobacteraceae bacterium]|nr:hypothetical protein [Paracoccaceae bacterium]
MFKRILGTLIGLGLAGFGVVAFLGQAGMAERSGNPDDFYAGLVMGGLLGFAGLVTLIAVWRRRKPGRQSTEDGTTIWAVGMTSRLDNDGYDGGGDGGD